MDAVTCLESGAGLQVVFPLTPPLSRRRRGENFVFFVVVKAHVGRAKLLLSRRSSAP